MERLVYTSHASRALSNGDVFSIVETAARNNPGRDVTGFLVFSQDRFLQLLEGEGSALDELLVVLGRDRRHCELNTHYRAPAATRAFPHWRMRRLDSSAIQREEVLRTLSLAEIGSRCSVLVGEFMSDPKRVAMSRPV